MANPEHVAKLKEGVAAWNAWRDLNPEIEPDLSGLNFTNPEWRASTLWDQSRSCVVINIPVAGVRPVGINLSNTSLFDSCLDGCDLWMADLSNCRMWNTSCRKTNFRHANLAHTLLTECDLTDASFRGGFLNHAILADATIVRTDFRNCRVDNAYVGGVKYRKSAMTDKCRGIGGAETVFGNATLRRDLLDQDYIDAKRFEWRWPWWNGARIFLLWPWAAFDYGRSWLRVAIFALTLIVFFGLGYSQGNIAHHIEFRAYGPTVQQAFYPWFVACMGFATLGISDMVEPLDGLGQALIIGNVLAGFVTLGLLLSVLGNSFARRA